MVDPEDVTVSLFVSSWRASERNGNAGQGPKKGSSKASDNQQDIADPLQQEVISESEFRKRVDWLANHAEMRGVAELRNRAAARKDLFRDAWLEACRATSETVAID